VPLVPLSSCPMLGPAPSAQLKHVLSRFLTLHVHICPRLDFGEAGRLLYDFVWSDFADWYIEAAKARLYGADEQAAGQASTCISNWQLLVLLQKNLDCVPVDVVQRVLESP
jgi:hypothetical protein